MLFDSKTYIERRRILREKVGSGLILFFGNNNAPCNYPANGYTFRQDSSFLYFFGLERDGLVGIIDADSGQEWLLGDDIDIEDIIWTGFVPSVHDLAAQSGVGSSAPLAQLPIMLSKARGRGQKIHFLPPYRHDHMIQIADLMDMHPLQTRAAASVDLIKAVVSMRSIKSDAEVLKMSVAKKAHWKLQNSTASTKTTWMFW